MLHAAAQRFKIKHESTKYQILQPKPLLAIENVVNTVHCYANVGQ